MRVNQGQEFVIDGYTPGGRTFDVLIFGYYEGDRLMYAARTRDGFTPASRALLLKRFRGLEIDECPFGGSSREMALRDDKTSQNFPLNDDMLDAQRAASCGSDAMQSR